MIKRKISLFFTLLANIILLTLAAIPHHHHDDEICIINPICHSNHENTDGNNTSHNHNSNGGNDSHLCLLEQEVILRSENLEQIIKSLDSGDNRCDFDGLSTISSKCGIIKYVPPEYSNVHFGFKSSLYSCFVNLSIGLRGPPIA